MSKKLMAATVRHARTRPYKEIVAWLATEGVQTSIGSLSNWFNRRKQCARFEEVGSRVQRYREWLKEEFPDISQRELDRRANVMFQTEAMDTGDHKTYLAFNAARHKSKIDKARLEQRDRALAQAREKWVAAQKSKIEAGLHALYLEVKDNAEARELFQKFKAVATKATT